MPDRRGRLPRSLRHLRTCGLIPRILGCSCSLLASHRASASLCHSMDRGSLGSLSLDFLCGLSFPQLRPTGLFLHSICQLVSQTLVDLVLLMQQPLQSLDLHISRRGEIATLRVPLVTTFSSEFLIGRSLGQHGILTLSSRDRLFRDTAPSSSVSRVLV